MSPYFKQSRDLNVKFLLRDSVGLLLTSKIGGLQHLCQRLNLFNKFGIKSGIYFIICAFEHLELEFNLYNTRQQGLKSYQLWRTDSTSNIVVNQSFFKSIYRWELKRTCTPRSSVPYSMFSGRLTFQTILLTRNTYKCYRKSMIE